MFIEYNKESSDVVTRSRQRSAKIKKLNDRKRKRTNRNKKIEQSPKPIKQTEFKLEIDSSNDFDEKK
jgi:hypothetical protein